MRDVCERLSARAGAPGHEPRDAGMQPELQANRAAPALTPQAASSSCLEAATEALSQASLQIESLVLALSPEFAARLDTIESSVRALSDKLALHVESSVQALPGFVPRLDTTGSRFPSSMLMRREATWRSTFFACRLGRRFWRTAWHAWSRDCKIGSSRRRRSTVASRLDSRVGRRANDILRQVFEVPARS